MPQQENVNLAPQTYQSQHELSAQFPIYCVQGSESRIIVNRETVLGVETNHFVLSFQEENTLIQAKKANLYTCSGAPLLTLCILPSWSM